MSGFDESIVKEFFEINGFLTHQFNKSESTARKKSAEDLVQLFVQNPKLGPQNSVVDFQIFASQVASIKNAMVFVQSWHTFKVTEKLIQSNTKNINLTDPSFSKLAKDFFHAPPGEETSFIKILIIPSLPTNLKNRDQIIESLKLKGIDGIITFRTILESLLRSIDPNKNYSKSELLETLRVLKIYDLVKNPQLELFS